MKHSVLIILSLFLSISLKGQNDNLKQIKSNIKKGNILKAIDIIDSGIDESDNNSASKYYKIISKIHRKNVSKKFFKFDKEIKIVNRLSEVIVRLDSLYHKDDVFKEFSFIRNTLNMDYCDLWKYKCSEKEFPSAIKYFKRAIFLYNLTAKYGGIENRPKISVNRNPYADHLRNEVENLKVEMEIAKSKPGTYIKGLDGSTTYLPSGASFKATSDYYKKSSELRKVEGLGEGLKVEIPLNKRVKIFIERELVNAGDISIRNNDTLSARMFYSLSSSKNIKLSFKAYSYLLENTQNKEELLYYREKLIHDALNSNIKFFVTVCSFSDEKSLLPLLDIVKSHEKQYDVYSLLRGVLLLYTNNLENGENVFNDIIENNKGSSVVLSSIGRAYLQYAISNVVNKRFSPSKQLEIFNKALYYLNKAKKVKNSEIINNSINLCNNYVMILEKKCSCKG